MKSARWVTLFAVTIEFTEPWAIGGNAVLDDEMKLPVVIDPRTKDETDPLPVLPGASIAGSLRATSYKVLRAEATERLFGHVTQSIKPDKKTKGTKTQASQVEVLGSRLLDEHEGMIGYRTRTAIDSKTGAAKTNMLRNEHVVKPASYRIVVQVNSGPDDQSTQNWLKVLGQWIPQLGRGRTYGLGRGQVNLIEHVSVNLNSEKGLEWWLFEKPKFFDAPCDLKNVPGELESDCQQLSCEHAAPEVRVSFRVAEPIHIGMAEEDQKGMVKLFTLFDAAMIPGTTWKGVLRHRTFMILQAIKDEELATKVTEYLYGSEERGRGILWFRNSPFFGPDGKSSVTAVKREHVAIDRFSGGAKNTAKFTWECIPPDSQVTLEINAPELVKDSELANLLHHTLRDLHDGMIGIGAGISRGYGHLEALNVQDIRVSPIDIEKLQAEVSDNEVSR